MDVLPDFFLQHIRDQEEYEQESNDSDSELLPLHLDRLRDVIEEVDESLGESEVSRLSEFQYYMNDEYVENLKDYNSRRRKMLPAWQVPIPEEVVPNE